MLRYRENRHQDLYNSTNTNGDMKFHAKLHVTLKLKVNHQCRSFYYITIVNFDLINVKIYIKISR